MLLLAVLIVAIVAPALFVGWALSRNDPHARDTGTTDAETFTRARITLAAVIVVVAVASFLFRGIRTPAFHQSSALFIGVPALLAVAALAKDAPIRNRCGMQIRDNRSSGIAALSSGEGMLCVLDARTAFLCGRHRDRFSRRLSAPEVADHGRNHPFLCRPPAAGSDEL